MITATTIVAQIAALAAIVILSMFEVGEFSVLTSRHWLYGTFAGVMLVSSSEITQTTMHSCNFDRYHIELIDKKIEKRLKLIFVSNETFIYRNTFYKWKLVSVYELLKDITI